MYIDRSYLGNQSYCNEIFAIKKLTPDKGNVIESHKLILFN
jgi:hypothetical protein